MLDAIPDKAGHYVGVIDRIVISTVNGYSYEICTERDYANMCFHLSARISEQTTNLPSCRCISSVPILYSCKENGKCSL